MADDTGAPVAQPDAAAQLQAAEVSTQDEITRLKAEVASLQRQLAEQPKALEAPQSAPDAAGELHSIADTLTTSTQHGPGLIEATAARIRAIAHSLGR